METTVVALGGNTLLRDGAGDVAEQRARVREAADALAPLWDDDRRVVLTHGNGPQVGALLLQQEAAPEEAPPRPLDVLVAETQAQVGYLLQEALDARLGAADSSPGATDASHDERDERDDATDDRNDATDDRNDATSAGTDATAVTVVTRTLVDADDPAFDDPTKPVGPFYAREEAADRPFETAPVEREGGERAFRRVVPSPEPLEIVEAGRIADLLSDGGPVVCAGGGGVPVVRTDDGLAGVEAVVDKDLASQVLAATLGADELLVLTDVEAAYVDYGGPDQRALGAVAPAELRRHLDAGEFGTGSMRPKVEACVRFVEGGGRRAVVTSPENLEGALEGDAGTRVTA